MCPNPYSPRQPQETAFYQLVEKYYSRFKQEYATRYESAYGFWRGIIDDTVNKFLECGIPDYGFARVRCPNCRHEFYVAFSCKQRCFCPSCHKKRILNLAHHLTANVLAKVTHRHFVFTVPKRFRRYFKYNRSLLKQLCRCAWFTIRDVYQSVLGEGAIPGAVMSIQTFGELIHWHPHIHALITDGSFSIDGSFRALPSLAVEPFRKLFEHYIFSMLRDADLITADTIASMQSWQHSGFSIHKDVGFDAGNTDGLETIIEYISRGPFSQERMVRVTPGGKVLYKAEHDTPRTFPHPDDTAGSRRNFEVFDPLEFLAAVTQHIPNKGEHLINYYGWYSNKSRGLRRKQSAIRIPQQFCNPDDEPNVSTKQARLAWAVLIKKVYEVDPLLCPECGGEMKVIAFITDRSVIRKILGISSTSPRSPPGIPDQVYSYIPCDDELPWADSSAETDAG